MADMNKKLKKGASAKEKGSLLVCLTLVDFAAVVFFIPRLDHWVFRG
jgi:hypothetical protein